MLGVRKKSIEWDGVKRLVRFSEITGWKNREQKKGRCSTADISTGGHNINSMTVATVASVVVLEYMCLNSIQYMK